MTRDKDLLGSLHGSQHGSRKNEGVTNNTLMPRANKLPGTPPPAKANAPAPHLLGSGSKIPESQESRMRSQFSTPDPLTYGKKKRNLDYLGEPERVASSIPCSAYKSSPTTPTSEGGGLLAGRKERQRAEKASIAAAKEQSRISSEHKRLSGQKEAMLSNLCSNPTSSSGNSETHRVVNIVMDINKKLGLPVNNMGSWKLPD